MKLRLPKSLLGALFALMLSQPLLALWDEDSPHYYHCDSGGVYAADHMTHVRKDVYDISARDACMEINMVDGPAVLDGDIILNGGGTSFAKGEKHWTLNRVYTTTYKALVMFNAIDRDAYAQWHISGNLTIKSDTAVLFWNHPAGSEYDDSTGWDTRYSEYSMPDTSKYIIRCGSVDESTLTRLKPYLVRDDFADNDVTGATKGGNWIKDMNDYSFYATTGEGGYSYIYLSQGGAPDSGPGSDENLPGTIIIGPCDSYTYDADDMPGVDNPLYLEGGTANLIGAPDDILNNNIIGGTSGILVTDGTQTFSVSGNTTLGYSIVGVQGLPGANLQVGKPTGNKSNVTLKGDRYESLETTVQNAILTVSQNTILGAGAGSMLSVGGDASVTNFGTVAADVQLAAKSMMLNQGLVEGGVDVAKGALFTNNGTVQGNVNIAGGASVYGSGLFGGVTVVQPGGLLYVGNSPGYQKHAALTFGNGSKLGVYIDGTTPASATHTGSGTHSYLSVSGALTIDGAVTVQVGIGRGILSSGDAPFTLVLMKAENADLVAASEGADFKLKITEGQKYLDEDTTELVWDAEKGELSFTSAVSEEAKAVLEADGVWDYANTLWASAAVMRDFVRSAEQQAIIGMPGQTTAWGGAIGSFVNMQDGFTYNGGGYTVGMQHAFTEKFRAGVALGQSFGSFKSDSDLMKSDQMGIMTAITTQYVTTCNNGKSYWGISSHLGYGSIENDASYWNGYSQDKAKWDDSMVSAGVRLDWRKQLMEGCSITLFAGLEYMHGSQETINIPGDGAGYQFRDGSMQYWRMPIGMTLRSEIALGGTKLLAPEATLGFVEDIARKNPRVKCSSYGESWSVTGSTPGREAFMLNVGFNLLFDQNWSLGAFYTLETRDEQLNQNANFSLRYSF